MSRSFCATRIALFAAALALGSACGNITAAGGYYFGDGQGSDAPGLDGAVADAAADVAANDTTTADVPGIDAALPDAALADLVGADLPAVDAQPADTSSPDAKSPDGATVDATPADAVTPDVPVSTLCKQKSDCAVGQTCDLAGCGVIGTCIVASGGCPKNLAPVCGCDGVTYGNACLAQQAGVGVASVGACTATANCTIGDPNTTCQSSEYCAAPQGTCSGSGTCTTKPQICPMLASPTCGCDGVTYGNPCMAAAAGVNVAQAGACGATKMCGGFGGFQCTAAGDVCDIQGCYPDAAGQCIAKPPVCPKIYAPVCGCDGITYTNDCQRIWAGMSKDHDGECVKVGACTVGVFDGSCSKSEFCKSDVGACSGPGTCTAIPMMCTDLYSPVCGCDGVTYGNACGADAAGMNAASSGECASVSKMCGGFAGIACSKSEYCDIQGCGFDMSGVCVPYPNSPCPKTMPSAQECGCDGNTYANACERQTNNIAFDYAGACGSPGGCVTAATCPPGQGCMNGTCQSCPPIPCAAMCLKGWVPDPCTCVCYQP